MERSEKKEAIRALGPLCAMHASTILLPQQGFEQWAVIACDQYTSQPDYWAETERIVGDKPSTLRLMLPELYLEAPDKALRIERIHAAMRGYLEDGTLRALSEGAVLVNRGGRLGLVIAFDLEFYNYGEGVQPLIRATEGTIVERIPPRQEIRRGAPLELPHILILLDDPGKTVIEPLLDDPLAKLYDFELMQGGGRITGHFVPLESLSALEVPLQELLKSAAEAQSPHKPLLYAVGDGNHSLATAKATWEEMKQGLSEQEQLDHPARYALCELVNLHNDRISFEPIHRLMTGAPDAYAALDEIARQLFGEDRPQSVPCITAGGEQPLRLGGGKLPVAALDEVLEAYRAAHGGSAIDYIHGDSVLRELGSQPGNAGFLLAGMRKQDLFGAVITNGALPKKTFSMGGAHEKRYYLECRAIDPAAPKARPFELD